MKKLISMLLVLLMLIVILISCKINADGHQENSNQKDDGLSSASDDTTILQTAEDLITSAEFRESTTEETVPTATTSEPLRKHDSKIDGALAEEMEKAALEQFGSENAPYGYLFSEYAEIEGAHACLVTSNGYGFWIDGGWYFFEIENYDIVYSSSKALSYYIYKDGRFYNIEDAYKENILSMDGVIKFAEKTAKKYGYDLYPES